ncbi:MAG: menaquinone biosynthesis decarboxylase [Nitrospinota bacterium]
MAYDSLADFVQALERAGELRRIAVEVESHLEVAEIADRAVKGGGPALLFEKVRGPDGQLSPFPLLINAFGSQRRMNMALGVEDVESLADRVAELLEIKPPEGFIDKVRLLPRLARLGSYFPETVRSGPCQEVVEVEGASLYRLPAIQCWPGDGGPYVTTPQVCSRSPETGKRNVGLYRMQLFDARTAGMHIHLHHDGAAHWREATARGERLPMACAIGGDPALTYAASAPLPPGLDELALAGFVRGKRVKLVECKTVDAEVSADADFVLEGYLEPGEVRKEGPFGDHTGFYSLADDYPVFHLTAITRRRDPIYLTTIVGRPPMEDYFLGHATERLFLPLIRMQLPEVVDLHMPAEGIFHNMVIVSIRKAYPFHARKVMYALWGMGQMSLAKVIVVVDADVNVHDLSEVAWRALASIDPRRDIAFVDGPVDALEHASSLPHAGSKMGVDATAKWASEGFAREWPPLIEMSPEVKERVSRRWGEYGLD